ncbi:M24 family metallopeptidase [Antarcticirhabdus aurantiaca]|uniref:Xaa-Pro peptidase family protein n=1 Tax=Antarcticirhabdus aurantiaca TaxID=2606717 RepID=A0ACD4NR89_9HYPH|nr:Xaa-Pro peptidase family protein [Antarcticirhabdus aurantiaca]WAJ29349.1 Xaa-Pro peptidase family protein [Jeongeuplla avenae]
MDGSRRTAPFAIEEGRGELLAPLSFAPAEYERRQAALRAAMRERGLDVFVSFSPENIFYLTGHDTPAYQYLQATIVTHDALPLNVLRSIDASNTLAASWSRRAVVYADHDDPVDAVAFAVGQAASRGMRIGLEDESFFVTPRRFQAIEARLAAAGLDAVPAHLVEPLRLVKSQEEIAHIRRAAEITTAAMQAAIGAARAGTSENEIAAAVWSSLVRGGGEFPGLPPFIVSGPRTSLGHATWAGRTLQAGDALAFEIPGVVRRYVAPLFRTGTVGPPPAEMRDLSALCIASLGRMIEAIRPGVEIGAVHAINVDTFARGGHAIGHRSGYSVGVNYAPDWGEGGILSIMDGETRRFEAGMVFHLVPGIFVPGRHVVVISETVLVTPTGCERLTNVPQDLFVV